MTSETTRSGWWAASHAPTAPPSETPVGIAVRCILRRASRCPGCAEASSAGRNTLSAVGMPAFGTLNFVYARRCGRANYCALPKNKGILSFPIFGNRVGSLPQRLPVIRYRRSTPPPCPFLHIRSPLNRDSILAKQTHRKEQGIFWRNKPTGAQSPFQNFIRGYRAFAA